MSFIDRAKELVHGDRQADYGHPLDNHTATAGLWRIAVRRKYGVDVPFDAEMVCHLNDLQKTSREMNAPHEDNLVDKIGYMENIDMIRQERRRRDREQLNPHKPDWP